MICCQVNFNSMEMSAPLVARLQRSQLAAVELMVRWSQHLCSLELQLGHLQVGRRRRAGEGKLGS